jgi:hypothetical protein
MTSSTRTRIGWVAVIAILLGGAYVIVARSGPAGPAATQSVYGH